MDDKSESSTGGVEARDAGLHNNCHLMSDSIFVIWRKGTNMA